MGKTSKASSSKHKRSKYSSQGRVKKSKNTRKSKLKKRGRRHDSDSSSEDDSRSSRSVSSFSSEDSYRGRSRHRLRKDVSRNKRKLYSSSSIKEDSAHARKQKRSKDVSRSKRRHYSSSPSSGDSAHAIKQERSKRNNESMDRKRSLDKKSMKKKARRDASVSSKSSRSWSCSTCLSSSSFSGDTGGNDKRKPKDYKVGGRKNGSRSCSFFSGHDGISEDWREEKVANMYNSKRLRSVITIMHESKEEGEQNRDQQKEEMVYDNDDYPSSRSNDSNDRGNKREMSHASHVESGVGKPIEDDNGEYRTSKPSDSSVMEGQSLRSDTCSGTNDALKESQSIISGTIECANNDDLEAVLRQRALENLRKFRQGAQVNSKSVVEQKAMIDNFTARADLGNIRPPTDEAKLLRGDSSCYLQNRGDTPNKMGAAPESKSNQDDILPTNKVAIADGRNVRMPNKPRLVTSALKQALSNVNTTPPVMPSSQEDNQTTLVGCRNAVGVEKMFDQAAAAVVSPGVTTEADNASVSASAVARSSAQDPNLNRSQNEPELQEKTMSVMRGGELVQVSYKVYIPKKTPALARRQLKR